MEHILTFLTFVILLNVPWLISRRPRIQNEAVTIILFLLPLHHSI
jgi:hypothetical protein